MKLELIQHSHEAINSCYIFKEFLDDKNYLNLVKNKIKELATNDEMNHMTNVKANMTNYKKLIEQEEFNSLHEKILETISNCIRLRTVHYNAPLKFLIKDSWAMIHKQNDRTDIHEHNGRTWAVVFYAKVPHETIFHLPDFGGRVNLQDNMLIFFPAAAKHYVDPFLGEHERLSMACNIDQIPPN